MRQDIKENSRDIITMEEYLKKRQAMRARETAAGAGGEKNPVSALKMAELLYI